MERHKLTSTPDYDNKPLGIIRLNELVSVEGTQRRSRQHGSRRKSAPSRK